MNRENLFLIIAGIAMMVVSLFFIKITVKDVIKAMNPNDAANPDDPNDMQGAMSIIILVMGGFGLALGAIVFIAGLFYQIFM